MKLFLIILPLAVGFIAMVATVLVVGRMMPREHTATASILVSKPAAAVWKLITDFDGQPAWRKDVKRIERLADRDGHRVHKEVGSGGDLTLEVEAMDPPRRMVTRIADDSLPFGGSWTYELIDEGGKTRLRITEQGVVKSAAFRYVGRILGQDMTIRNYLKAAAAGLGEAGVEVGA
ncbi:MAG: SRPBCC family protein [Planctomycetes bacterium]|nr:SRPBCC family protein [Planctomycetota bacterium]